MAYQERIKNFDRIRNYVRDFFVYGYKVRNEYDEKSSRSYDDERKHIESWLGEYLKYRYEDDGKINYLSIDSRSVAQNPLYKALKTSSFTDTDITLHFALMSIFIKEETFLSVQEIIASVDVFLSHFRNPIVLDQSTVRKKLIEYESIGLLVKEKYGRKLCYRRAEDVHTDTMADAISFFAEVSPCGIIGSFIQDCHGLAQFDSPFRFKQDYFASALDSEIVARLLSAMHDKKQVFINKINLSKKKETHLLVIPLRIVKNAQTGRAYLLAYDITNKIYQSYRIDYITSINEKDDALDFLFHREQIKKIQEHMWGVELKNNPDSYEHVEILFHVGLSEQHILQRLMREKRCGTIEQVDDQTWRFTADVTNTAEMLPWLRTYICRIKKVCMSNTRVYEAFIADLHALAQQYGLMGGKADGLP